ARTAQPQAAARRHEERPRADPVRDRALVYQRSPVRAVVLGGRSWWPGGARQERARHGGLPFPADERSEVGGPELAPPTDRLPVRLSHQRDRVQPDRHAAADAHRQVADGEPVARLAGHHRTRGGARGQHPVMSAEPESPDGDPTALERSIREIGTDLAAAFPSSTRHPLRALDARAMDLASADQELKAALFTFVDV